ncbi:hypothetical protein Gotur_032722 [Gossypium turneri]
MANPNLINQGLFAYRSPEYVRSQQISAKSDVYCLGIVILEIITGKFPSQYLNNAKGGIDIVQWVQTSIADNQVEDLIDPEISHGSNSIDQMVKLLRIGADCTESNPDKRLGMKEVIDKINESLWFSTTADPQTFPNKILHPSDSSTSSSSTDRDDPHHRRRNPKTDYEEEQARMLQASLRHVMKFGWSEEAMIAGAKEIGVSPSIVGYFPHKAAALVHMRALLSVSMFRFPPISDNDNIFLFLDLPFFMDDCLQRLIDRIDSKEESHHFIPSRRQQPGHSKASDHQVHWRRTWVVRGQRAATFVRRGRRSWEAGGSN